jgi:hypothetical protein
MVLVPMRSKAFDVSVSQHTDTICDSFDQSTDVLIAVCDDEAGMMGQVDDNSTWFVVSAFAWTIFIGEVDLHFATTVS